MFTVCVRTEKDEEREDFILFIYLFVVYLIIVSIRVYSVNRIYRKLF